jgi:hypothetical protein
MGPPKLVELLRQDTDARIPSNGLSLPHGSCLPGGSPPGFHYPLRARYAAPAHVLRTVIRDDRAEELVTLLLDDFLELVAEWWELRKR